MSKWMGVHLAVFLVFPALIIGFRNSQSAGDDSSKRAVEREQVQGYNCVHVVEKPDTSLSCPSGSTTENGMLAFKDNNGNFTSIPPAGWKGAGEKPGPNTVPEFKSTSPGGGVGAQIPQELMPYLAAERLPDGTLHLRHVPSGTEGSAHSSADHNEGRADQ